MDLSQIRQLAGLTQVQLAERMGTEQTVVSRLERQTDWRLSTLVEYLLGTGTRVRLVVDAGDSSLDMVLSAETKRFEI